MGFELHGAKIDTSGQFDIEHFGKLFHFAAQGADQLLQLARRDFPIMLRRNHHIAEQIGPPVGEQTTEQVGEVQNLRQSAAAGRQAIDSFCRPARTDAASTRLSDSPQRASNRALSSA